MKDHDEVGIYEAKTHLADLVDRAARGERITITRRGKAVAKLGPADPAPASMDELFARMDAFHAKQNRSWREIVSLKHEGHKY